MNVLIALFVVLKTNAFLFLLYTDEQKSNEGYNNIKRVMESDHEDNVFILKAMIQTSDDQPLFDGVNKKRVCF